jgi:hypothetical protein
VTADELSIVFARQEHINAKIDIWMATRDSVDEPFRSSQPIHNVNRYSALAPWISGDGRFLLFADGWTQPRRPGEPDNIFVSYRESLDAEFGAPIDIDEFWPGSNINTSIIENTPRLSPDWPLAGSSVYYMSGSFASLADGTRILEAEWITTPGDFDATGELTVEDFDLLSERVRAGTHRRGFDLNADRLVDQADRQIWVHDLKGTYFGDANLDGEFNSSDLVLVFGAGEYEDDVAGNSSWATGDWNGDGEFTSIDLVTAFQDGGYAAGPRVAAVPEPSTALLLVLGFVAVLPCAARCQPS